MTQMIIKDIGIEIAIIQFSTIQNNDIFPNERVNKIIIKFFSVWSLESLCYYLIIKLNMFDYSLFHHTDPN